MLLVAALSVAAPPRYEVSDLRLKVSAQKVVMNDRGTVAGTMKMPDGSERPFVWIGGKVRFIGNGTREVAAINSRNEVVAIGDRNVVLWRDGVERSFTVPQTDGRPTVAGIDDGGTFLATFYGTHGTDGSFENFVFPPTAGRLPRNARLIPEAIDNFGNVAGAEVFGRGPRGHRSVLWSNGAKTDLGSPSVTDPLHIVAMNDKGAIVGDAQTGAPRAVPIHHAFLWRGGKLTDLSADGPSVNSYALAINDSGQIVGAAGKAALWQDGHCYDLETLVDPAGTRTLESAVAINRRGQILVKSQIRPSSWVESELYLLTPK